MKSLACRRFGRLLNELADREPTKREGSFLEAHRARCGACRSEEEAACLSLDLLRGAVFQTDVPPAFERRVVRRARAMAVREGLRYWSPALMGGAVAAGLVLAALQALTTPAGTGIPSKGRARRDIHGSLAVKGPVRLDP